MLNIRFAHTAGAMTSPDTVRFFRAIGINVKQGYGPAETGMCLAHWDGDVNYDSIGVPYYKKEVRLTAGGELTFRGLLDFMGYYNDPAATAKKVDAQRWIYTGDAATITDEGHVIFLDRMEDMRHLASGAAYSPQYVETRMRFSAYVKDAMVVGDNKDFISVIVIIDFDNVGAWAEQNKIAYTTFIDLSQKKEVGELILKDILRVNKNLPEWQKIKKFVNLHKEFDADEEELTRSKKLKRAFMENRYKDLIDAIYTGKSDHTIVSTVTYQDGRKGTTTSVLQIRNVG
jgi:long-chain acyl-CoA synthetase